MSYLPASNHNVIDGNSRGTRSSPTCPIVRPPARWKKYVTTTGLERGGSCYLACCIRNENRLFWNFGDRAKASLLKDYVSGGRQLGQPDIIEEGGYGH